MHRLWHVLKPLCTYENIVCRWPFFGHLPDTHWNFFSLVVLFNKVFVLLMDLLDQIVVKDIEDGEAAEKAVAADWVNCVPGLVQSFWYIATMLDCSTSLLLVLTVNFLNFSSRCFCFFVISLRPLHQS